MCLKDALRKLSPMISESRRAQIASVVAARSESVAILTENVHNEANVSAVLRSMDAFGCLHLHILETIPSNYTDPYRNTKKKRFPPRTDAGARNWVDIHYWTHTKECVSHLKDNYGYSLACASPTASTSIADIDFSKKLLVAFGNEGGGISAGLDGLADLKFSLPMCGFVQSFNISVSAALVLYHAYLHRTSIHVRTVILHSFLTVCGLPPQPHTFH